MIAFADPFSYSSVRPFVTPEMIVCPKCQGQGQLRLLRRNAAIWAVEICPACEGRGLAARRHGAADLTPSVIGRRS